MTRLSKAFALTMLTALPMAAEGATCINSWTSTSSTTPWNESVNWGSGCIPGSNSTLDQATFPTVAASTMIIFLNTGAPQSETLALLNFDSSSTSYTIANDNLTTNYQIQFSGTSQLQVTAGGSHTIAANIGLAAGATLDISVSPASGQLTLAEGMDGSSTNVNFSGPGLLLNQWNGAATSPSYATNSFEMPAGTLTISGGTFQNSNVVPISTGNLGTEIVPNGVNITGGTLLFTNTATITGNAQGSSMAPFAGVTVNNASMILENSGPVTGGTGARGTNVDMAGTWTIENGGLVYNSNSASIGSTFSAGSNISTVSNLIISNGTLANFNSGPVSGNASIGASIAVDGNLTMSSGTVTNNNTGTVSAGAFGSVILVLGTTQINGGTFENNANVKSSTINISSPGIWTGNGVIQDNAGGSTALVTNAGTVIPGGPSAGSAPGTMQINGSYTQTSAGTLVINLLNTSSFSQLNLTGAASLNGTLDIEFSPGASIGAGDSFKILQAGNVAGTFSLVDPSLGNLIYQVQYFPTYVLLSFIGAMTNATKYPNYAEALFSSVNQINIQLDTRMAQLRKRFPRMREDIHFIGAAPKEGVLLADNSQAIALNPQVEEKQQQLEQSVRSCDQRWNVYFGPKGNVGRVLTKGDSAGFHYDTIGAMAGFDYAYSKMGIGFLADYDHIDGRVAHHWGKVDVDQVHGSLYVTYIREKEQQLAFNMILGGGYEWYDIKRNTLLGSAHGTPQGVEFDGLWGMEYTFEKSAFNGMPERLQVVPLINLQYMYLHMNGYREHGAGMFDLNYFSQNVRSLRSTLGTRVNYSWRWSNVAFTPELNLGWQWEYFDKDRHIGFSAAGASSRLKLPQPGRNVAYAGLDFLVTLFDKYGVEANYQCEWNTLYLDHFFYVGCNFRF
jgi:hypothetical protein